MEVYDVILVLIQRYPFQLRGFIQITTRCNLRTSIDLFHNSKLPDLNDLNFISFFKTGK